MADKFAIITGASTGIGFELASIAAEMAMICWSWLTNL